MVAEKEKKLTAATPVKSLMRFAHLTDCNT